MAIIDFLDLSIGRHENTYIERRVIWFVQLYIKRSIRNYKFVDMIHNKVCLQLEGCV